MVTFICENCDKTLKKNQVDRHLYQCNSDPYLVCIDCNKTFTGNSHKAHTTCISEQEKTMGQYYKAKKPIKKVIEPWKGWKKSIRKGIKKDSIYERDLKTLMKEIVDNFIDNNPSFDRKEAEKIFEKKIKNNKFEIKGDKIKFIKKEMRK